MSRGKGRVGEKRKEFLFWQERVGGNPTCGGGIQLYIPIPVFSQKSFFKEVYGRAD